jgi:hypothetical protein
VYDDDHQAAAANIPKIQEGAAAILTFLAASRTTSSERSL